MAVRDEILRLVTLGPSPVRWPTAVQAALAVGIPVAVFTLLGRTDLGLLASAGAFTALYLGNRSRRERALLLPIIAVAFVVSSALGVVSAGSHITSLIALFGVAVLATVLALGLSIGPPGPLFFALVTGVSTYLAAPASLGGKAISGWLIVGMLALGTVIAYLIVIAPLLVPASRSRDRILYENRAPYRLSFGGADRAIVYRLVAASALALLISSPLGVTRAYWVLVTVMAILQNGHQIRVSALRGVHRLLGTLVGVGLYAALMLLHPQGLWLALMLALLQFSVEMVVVRNYGLALVLITPLALTISTQGHPSDLGGIITERVFDTLLGAGVAFVVLVAAYLVRKRNIHSPAFK
ncbi:MAG: hypothetical protein JWM51_2273 [Microbacteriaceae bacterium]|nr:hypothetical protein [Microbacteriaceae bacterium]